MDSSIADSELHAMTAFGAAPEEQFDRRHEDGRTLPFLYRVEPGLVCEAGVGTGDQVWVVG
ncbi:MAG TPA: hypothetical protein PKH39_16900 [Woeseiaceae bacterium]|nr:hypothetical protein [Woeseiaceae bacterium]